MRVIYFALALILCFLCKPIYGHDSFDAKCKAKYFATKLNGTGPPPGLVGKNGSRTYDINHAIAVDHDTCYGVCGHGHQV